MSIKHSRGDILVWTNRPSIFPEKEYRIICMVLSYEKIYPDIFPDIYGYKILMLETNSPSVPMNTVWISGDSPIVLQSEKIVSG